MIRILVLSVLLSANAIGGELNPKAELKAPMEGLTARILDILDRPRFKIKTEVMISSDQPLRIVDLQGTLDVPLKKDLVVPLNSTDKKDSTSEALTLNLVAHTKGSLLSINAADDAKGVLQGHLRFLKGNKSSFILAEVKNKDIELLAFQISGLDLAVGGLKDSAAKDIAISGTCLVQQDIVDLTTLNNNWKAVDCSFNGTYTKVSGKYKVLFKYNSQK